MVDSGIPDHMTSLCHLFHSYTPCSGPEKVRLADGSFSSIAGEAIVKISRDINLKSVLHIPKLTCNLFSFSEIYKDSIMLLSITLIVFFGTRFRRLEAREIEGLHYFDKVSFKLKL